MALRTASIASSLRSGRPGHSSTARSAPDDGSPGDVELPRDRVQLRGLDDDPPARAGTGTEQAAGVRSGVVEQVPQIDGGAMQGRHAAQSRRLRLAGDEHGEQRKPGCASDYRKLVSVDIISSLEVITLLFIS